jgi:hypothetical protein
MAFKDWSTTAASNTTVGGVNIAELTAMSNLNNGMRAIMADVRTALATGPTDIACAATINLASSDDFYMRVTGSTGPVTSFGTVASGIWRLIRWASTPTITHNATSMILPTGADITVVAGDLWLVFSEGSGNWRIAVIRGAGAAAGAVTTSGLTMTTGRLLGRTTASTGAIEEITYTPTTSWTPVIAGGSTPGTQTYSQQTGRYYRIGNLVFIAFRVTMTAKDGATAGAFTITGLPFTALNLAGFEYPVTMGFASNVDVTAGKFVAGAIAANSAAITMNEIGDNAAYAALGAAAIQATTDISGSAVYIAA